ncbi:hypothetical protein HY214_03755 [Candidatus Roizmanbacteria bacterium]|nr:hypothetical protein [Candidatus Roizmanbacteria bacterium]
MKRGEIATLLAIGALIVIGVSTVVSSVFLKNRQTQTTKASGTLLENCDDNNWYCAGECADPNVRQIFSDTYKTPLNPALTWRTQKASNCKITVDRCSSTTVNDCGGVPSNQQVGSAGGGGGNSPSTSAPGCFHLDAKVTPEKNGNGYKFNTNIIFKSDGGDGSIQLQRNGRQVAGWNTWSRGAIGDYTYEPAWTGSNQNFISQPVSGEQSMQVTYKGIVANATTCPNATSTISCTFSVDSGGNASAYCGNAPPPPNPAATKAPGNARLNGSTPGATPPTGAAGSDGSADAPTDSGPEPTCEIELDAASSQEVNEKIFIIPKNIRDNVGEMKYSRIQIGVTGGYVSEGNGKNSIETLRDWNEKDGYFPEKISWTPTKARYYTFIMTVYKPSGWAGRCTKSVEIKEKAKTTLSPSLTPASNPITEGSVNYPLPTPPPPTPTPQFMLYDATTPFDAKITVNFPDKDSVNKAVIEKVKNNSTLQEYIRSILGCSSFNVAIEKSIVTVLLKEYHDYFWNDFIDFRSLNFINNTTAETEINLQGRRKDFILNDIANLTVFYRASCEGNTNQSYGGFFIGGIASNYNKEQPDIAKRLWANGQKNIKYTITASDFNSLNK